MRKPETSVRYAERFRLLSRMAAREVMQDVDSPISLAALVRWLSDRRAMLRSASWRQYRCAIDHHCKTVLELDEGTRKELLKSLYDESDPETIAARKALPPATSSHVLKRLLDSDWDKLLDSLKRGLAGNSAYDAPLLAYLEAGRASGLRPCEWARVRLVTFPGAAVSVLVVKNAKEDEVRAHGDFRRLVFAHETCGASLMAIRRWLAIVDSSLAGTVGSDRAAIWEKFYNALGDRLYYVSRRIWNRKKHPALYTTRHMFAAAAKAVFAPDEVAAVMGHKLDTTATQHYARPPRGQRRMPHVELPTAHPRDLGRVVHSRKFDPEALKSLLKGSSLER
ncbi:hypothetical protein IY145_17665 [Methylosinus sp. H3A]|uniref:hypothetical protein n=1 Tax=Methylosinus sp. H3A TaxID=2785786 RepID=UPI0018C208D5|nr:hypothetical protein [Methylosinus sp. H3A]MBG0811189.1 hypothetical protein [Methylosinus sp. H3A]